MELNAMKTFRRLIRPPETDEEYVELVRSSLTSEKANGFRNLLMSIGFLGLFLLAWYLLDWPIVDDSPELYYRRAAGLHFGMVGGALVGFCLYSAYELDTRRTLLSLCTTKSSHLVFLASIFMLPVWRRLHREA
jgi:hypothetical protein